MSLDGGDVSNDVVQFLATVYPSEGLQIAVVNFGGGAKHTYILMLFHAPFPDEIR